MEMNELLVDRTTCLLYKATTVLDNTPNGWIGGNPPEVVMNSTYEETLKGYRFYFTFLLPDIERQISVFLPDFSEYLKHSIYPDCAIKVIGHAVSPEANQTDYRMEEFSKHFISFYKKTENDNTDPVNGENHYLIKLGGTPELIQNKSYYTAPVENAGYRFLLQMDEFGYPDELLKGSYPLCFGSLYLYARQEDAGLKDIIAAFWQSE